MLITALAEAEQRFAGVDGDKLTPSERVQFLETGVAALLEAIDYLDQDPQIAGHTAPLRLLALALSNRAKGAKHWLLDIPGDWHASPPSENVLKGCILHVHDQLFERRDQRGKRRMSSDHAAQCTSAALAWCGISCYSKGAILNLRKEAGRRNVNKTVRDVRRQLNEYSQGREMLSEPPDVCARRLFCGLAVAIPGLFPAKSVTSEGLSTPVSE
jgi:hypothetical protein